MSIRALSKLDVLKSKIKKVLWITVAWTFISLFNYLIGYGYMIQFGMDEARFRILSGGWWGGLVTGIVAGLTGGTILVFSWDQWLRTKPYGWTIRNILISFTGVFLVVAYINMLMFAVKFLDMPIASFKTWNHAFFDLFKVSIILPYITWIVIVALTMIVFLVNDKYGPGVFVKFLLGKYFNPKREERVFMFMDLRSSTSIAEKLGEEAYFNFIRDVYKEATPGILLFRGEIYQYVGDEVVISWPIEKGVEKGNCLNCYLEVKKLLNLKKDYFNDKYGVIPEFKAGLHYGAVMTGEVGVVKRDIAYSGDVLNTTSRIQEMCNLFHVDVLLSNDLISKMDFAKDQLKSIGEISLRGKTEKVELFSI